MGTQGTACGGSAGMHLVLALDPTISDVAVSAQALRQGIVAHALSVHLAETTEQAWSGLVLGYAQVPVQQIDGAVRQLAAILRRAR